MRKYFSLYSGGKDSWATTEYLASTHQLAGIVTIDTGIATPDWLPFIKESSKRWGAELTVLSTTASYDALVLKYGFPGPPAHGMFMNYLKGRAIRKFKKLFPGAWLASGVRKDESSRRFRNTKEIGSFEGVPIWSPLYNWSTERVWECVNGAGYERSPAYQTLCMSGDCLCGAYATKLERAAIIAFYPETWERIERLEKATGKEWGWGANRGKRGGSPLCVDCEAK